ncbi:hypothetical protein [Thermithiobacillus plumbiphilus]|uniref:Uncharacterized protein n=1 Tax=Thermithiobacillus plumbiphilus TaxID=1729899 RepID=A0ABU9D7E3_9PROT
MMSGFFSGVGTGLSILLPFFLVLMFVLWLLLPVLLIRQNRLLAEIRDLLELRQRDKTISDRFDDPTS